MRTEHHRENLNFVLGAIFAKLGHSLAGLLPNFILAVDMHQHKLVLMQSTTQTQRSIERK